MEYKDMIIKEKILPYFPLNIALLPGEDIPLRIFEPRYKQLINECSKHGITFGMPFIDDSKVQPFGSEVRLKQIVATNSLGEMVIVVEGVNIFEVLSLEDPMSDKLYSGGKVKVLDFNQFVQNTELIRTVIYYMDHIDPGFIKNFTPEGIYILDIARALNLSSTDKFKYIFTKSPEQQEKFLLMQLKCTMKLREQEKKLNNDFSLN